MQINKKKILYHFPGGCMPYFLIAHPHKYALSSYCPSSQVCLIFILPIVIDSWTLVQLPVLDLRINLHPSLDKGLMTTGDPVSWTPERTTQESSGPSPPDYSSVIP
ncbi:hypothetical protein STEG23_019266, partial [Scotinomys teguina]